MRHNANTIGLTTLELSPYRTDSDTATNITATIAARGDEINFNGKSTQY